MTEKQRKQTSGRKSVVTAEGAVAHQKEGGAGGGSTGGGSRGGGNALAVVALLVALATAGGAGYLWVQTQAAKRQAGSDTRLQTVVEQSTANTGRIGELTSSLSAANTELTTVKEQLAAGLEKQKQLQQEASQGAQAGLSLLDQEVEGKLSKQTRAQQAALEAAQNEIGMLRNELAATRKELDGQLKAEVEKMSARLETLQLAQRGLNQSLDVVRETVASGGDKNAWTLSEVDYLLQIADHRLQFQEDVNGALAALILARQRLESVGELPFASVQSMIAEEIAALKGVSLLDRSALAQRLGELARTASELPIRNEARTAAMRAKAKADREAMGVEVDTSVDGWWQDAAEGAWSELKKLVVVRNERRTGAPLIAPEEEYFLAQNVRLKLEIARLAVMMDDGAVYQDSLAMASSWLETYFDPADDDVIDTLKQIKALQQVQLHPYLPDISRSLKTFRDVMEERKPLRTLPDSSTTGFDPQSTEEAVATGDKT